MSKKKEWPKRIGKDCGGTLHGDGRIEIAPVYADMIDAATLEDCAVDALLESVTKHCQAMLVQIQKRKKYFWDSVRENYELDFDNLNYVYEPRTKTLRSEKKSEDDKSLKDK